MGDAKEGADCILILRLGIACTSTPTLANSHANPALFRKAARRRRRRLLLSVDAPVGSGASDFVKRRRLWVHIALSAAAIRGLMTLASDRSRRTRRRARQSNDQLPEAWILLRDMLLGPSRRRGQQVKDLCNDIDAVNGPSVLLV